MQIHFELSTSRMEHDEAQTTQLKLKVTLNAEGFHGVGDFLLLGFLDVELKRETA